MKKMLRLTLIRLGRDELLATVTLGREKDRCIDFWMASVVVEIDGEEVRHSTGGHPTERAALLVMADWLLLKFAASSTHLETGSRVAVLVAKRSDSRLLYSKLSRYSTS